MAASQSAHSFDLSDLDPFHSSPRIFTPPTQSTSSTSSNSVTPPPPLPLASTAVPDDHDPLSSFSSLMSFDPHPPSLPISTPQAQQLAAHHTRREEVMSDLERSPWDLMSEEPEESAIEDEDEMPARGPGRSRPGAGGAHLRRASSTASRRDGTSFSPPRRLSGLMEPFSSLASSPSTSSSPPHPRTPVPLISHPEITAFHPSSPRPISASDSFRSTASHSGSFGSPTAPSNDFWSDFQSAPAVHPPHLPASSYSVPQVGDPLKAAYARQLMGGSYKGASLPVKGKYREEHHEEPLPEAAHNVWAQDSNGDSAIPPIKLLGVRDGVRRALDEDIAEGIRPNLPPRLRLSTKWTLLYSLDQHGISIQTLYDRMKVGTRGVESGIVIVVKDETGAIFGAYVNEALKESKTYYGDGTCFLWKATPFPPSDFRVGSSVKTFHWTGRNTYLVLSEMGYISVGGGDGKYGLWVDGVFEKGFTSRCPCFANEPLTDQSRWVKGPGGGDESKFEVLQFECWAVAL